MCSIRCSPCLQPGPSTGLHFQMESVLEGSRKDSSCSHWLAQTFPRTFHSPSQLSKLLDARMIFHFRTPTLVPCSSTPPPSRTPPSTAPPSTTGSPLPIAAHSGAASSGYNPNAAPSGAPGMTCMHCTPSPESEVVCFPSCPKRPPPVLQAARHTPSPEVLPLRNCAKPPPPVLPAAQPHPALLPLGHAEMCALFRDLAQSKHTLGFF